jgi:hypothetical protein
MTAVEVINIHLSLYRNGLMVTMNETKLSMILMRDRNMLAIFSHSGKIFY